jgi:hypothetical protein
VTLAREAEVEGEVGERSPRLLEELEGTQQTHPRAITVEREAGVPAEDAGEVKGGRAHAPGDLVEGNGLAEPPKQECLGPFDELGVAPACLRLRHDETPAPHRREE